MKEVRADGGALRDDFFNEPAEIHVEPFAAGDFQTTRVQSELVQDGRVDVGDIVPIFDRVKSELVGRAMRHSSLDSAAGQPGAKCLRMMIAPGSLCAG